MKKIKPIAFAVMLVALLVIVSAVSKRTVDPVPPETNEIATIPFISNTVASTLPEDTASPVIAETDTAAQDTTAQASVPAVMDTTVNNSAPVTVVATTQGRESASDDVTLNVDLPSANGEVYVDVLPSNRFITIVTDERGIAAENLVAVYSLPDTGQNYVLEFKASAETRNADSLYRVFLIDTKGKIASVCSSDVDLCENVSAVENWFCMNVILKKMILPSIENRLS